jgi:hypothetical protein
VDPPVQPDIEARSIAFLAASADLQVLIEERVFRALPNPATYPLITLFQLDAEAIVEDRLYRHRLQITSWADRKKTAYDVAATALRVIHDLVGVRQDAFVSDVSDESVLQWAPDPPTDRPRYISRVGVVARPLP